VLAGHSANAQVDRIAGANVKDNAAVWLVCNDAWGCERVHGALLFRDRLYRTPNITDPDG